MHPSLEMSPASQLSRFLLYAIGTLAALNLSTEQSAKHFMFDRPTELSVRLAAVAQRYSRDTSDCPFGTSADLFLG